LGIRGVCAGFIVREGEPAILNFEQIKNLAAQWDERFVPID
jgi:hypothetical protein